VALLTILLVASAGSLPVVPSPSCSVPPLTVVLPV